MIGRVLNEVKAMGSQMQETDSLRFARDASTDKKLDEILSRQRKYARRLEDLITEFNVSYYY